MVTSKTKIKTADARAASATADEQPKARRVAKTVDPDPTVEQAREIVTQYMDWWKAEKGAPIINSSRMFHALVKSYVLPALKAHIPDRDIRRALADCARSGHEWPSDPVWRRTIDTPATMTPDGPPAVPARLRMLQATAAAAKERLAAASLDPATRKEIMQ